MKRPILIILLLFYFIGAIAQKEAAVWYFGNNAGIDFNSGAPMALTDGMLRTAEGCATISDFNGNMLFYTDGRTIWNRSHNPMPNGTGLNGHPSSTQSAIIVPFPDNPDLYYVFTIVDAGNPEGLQYNIVDMKLAAGLGDVTMKNQLLDAPVTEKLTAVTHANESDIWVMTRHLDSNDFAAYLVSSTGLNTTPIVSSIPPADNDLQGVAGYLKFSPDGGSIASVSPNGVQLFSFDSNTGIVNNFIDLRPSYAPLPHVNFFVYAYGVEFSPDSSKLYISGSLYSNGTPRHVLYQFDLNNPSPTAIIASGTLIMEQPIEMLGLQTAIDGKIYVTQYEEHYLGAIDNPNAQGLGCGYNSNVLDLGSGECLLGLPPFITSYFVVGLQASNFCYGDATEFTVDTNGPVTSINWDFGDGNTSALENPTHTYTASGTYTVSVTATTASETKTESKDITIYETPTANSVTDFEVCSITPNYEFDLSIKDFEILGGQLALENIIDYYPTLTDAQNGTNQLPTLYTNTSTLEKITVRISNRNNPSCFDTESFDLIVKEAPILNPVTDWTVCDMDADGLYDFDLTQKDAEILNGQSAATFSVSYHITQTDADNNGNPIGPIYINTTSPETVFFRIQNSVHPECFERGSFNIEVITAVNAITPPNMEVCDDNNDGIFNFDLSTQDNAILNGQSASSFNVSYHATQAEADSGTNVLDKTNFRNTTPDVQTIFARVQNIGNSDCYATTHFDLVVYDSPVVQTVMDWQVCDVDNDGIHSFDLTEKDVEIFGSQSPTDFTITYHETQADADADTNAIAGTFQNTANPQMLFYRIENSSGTDCYVTYSFVLEVFDSPTAGTLSPMIACDVNETGILTFDLSAKDSEVLNGQNEDTFEVFYFASAIDAGNNTNPLDKKAYSNIQLQETIYARTQNKYKSDCFDTSEFEINVNPLPQPILEETYVICPDSPELNIDGGDFESWSWSNGNGTEIETDRYINITDLGNYTLTVTQTSNGSRCEKTVPFEVVSSGAPEDFTTEIGNPSDNVTIIVNTIGTGEFEYSSDGENFQDSNRLEVFPGEHTVYVRDKFLCRTISKEVIALGYQKFFTPNGDGANDSWNIIGADFYPQSQLYIYDRYGKLLQQISPMTTGWDGSYKGQQLPSSDYWFRYVFDNGKVFTGHFSIKR